jgi:outer membrane lipoprotein SlyB
MLGCESRTSSNVYAHHQAQRIQRVGQGEVIDVRQVEIEGSTTGLGTIAGGILGGAIGSTIGEGSGKDVATVFGLIAGALLGAGFEEDASHQCGLEITVRLDGGEAIAIVQVDDEQFNVGDQVRVLQQDDGSARVVLNSMAVRNPSYRGEIGYIGIP